VIAVNDIFGTGVSQTVVLLHSLGHDLPRGLPDHGRRAPDERQAVRGLVEGGGFQHAIGKGVGGASPETWLHCRRSAPPRGTALVGSRFSWAIVSPVAIGVWCSRNPGAFNPEVLRVAATAASARGGA